MKEQITTLGVLVLLGGLASTQEPASKLGKQEQLVKVATLGAATRAPSKAEVEELSLKFEVRARGQVVTEVSKGGAAEKAGIKAGDVLVKLANTELYSQDDIADFLRVSKPGEKVECRVSRYLGRPRHAIWTGWAREEERRWLAAKLPFSDRLVRSEARPMRRG